MININEFNILAVVIIIWFIYRQYTYRKVTRLAYLIIPLISLFYLYNTIIWNNLNTIIFLLILAISLGIGYAQAKYAKHRIRNKTKYYYLNSNQIEQKIYVKESEVRGGTVYLLGWILILIIQIILMLILQKSEIKNSLPQEIYEDTMKEILNDTFIITRFGEKGKYAWIAWELYGFTALSYTLGLSKRFTFIKEKVFGQEK